MAMTSNVLHRCVFMWVVPMAFALSMPEAPDCKDIGSCAELDASDASPLLQTKAGFQSNPTKFKDSSFESEKLSSTWSNIAIQTCKGCQKATSNHSSSSACCREGGQKGWGTSRMFQLQNAIYDNGALWVTGQPGVEEDVKQCFSGCSATWFPGCCPHVQVDEIDPRHSDSKASFAQISVSIPAFLPLLSIDVGQQPSLKCSEEGWHESALVVNRDSSLYQFNMYHYFIDSLFVGFLTASHMQLESGCPAEPVHVYVAGEDSLPRVIFDPIWESLFGSPLRNLSKAHGCYRKIIYGFMENQRFMHHPESKNAIFRSPVMMPWMMSFSRNLLAVVPAPRNHSALKAISYLVLASHQRMPPWVWDFNWERYDDPLRELSLLSPVVRYHLHNMPVNDQIAVVSRARGMISATGAAFVHQIFMPTHSALLVITTPTNLWASPTNPYPDCAALPETWHESTALHLGHTAIQWRTCYGSDEFLASNPVLMLKFLLERRRVAEKNREASVCYVLRRFNNSMKEDGWPSCDTVVTLPLPSASSFSTCGKWSIGTAIDVEDEWSDEAVNPKGIE